MPQDPRQRYPNVAIEVLGVGRAGRGIVMDARPLDLRAVAFGGRVVQGQQQPLAAGQLPQQQRKQSGSHRFGLASHGGDEVVITAEAASHGGSPQPTGHGLRLSGEQDTQQQDRQPPAAPSVQAGRQPIHPFRPFLRTFPRRHPWLSRLRVRFQHRNRDGRAIFCQHRFSSVS